MVACVFENHPNKCGEQNKHFYICRRERDAQLFHSIKKWEIEHFNGQSFTAGHTTRDVDPLTPQQKSYLTQLQQERQGMIQRFESTPSNLTNKHKRWRMAADIEQLEWRSNYLGDSIINKQV